MQVAAGGGRIDIVPELAAGPGSFNDGTLTVTLVEGARFHDDAPITPADVVASWRRLGQIGPLRARWPGR
ncbi:MAG: ABC transporter substrate-binding protein [Myxococcota bacterium]